MKRSLQLHTNKQLSKKINCSCKCSHQNICYSTVGNKKFHVRASISLSYTIHHLYLN